MNEWMDGWMNERMNKCAGDLSRIDLHTGTTFLTSHTTLHRNPSHSPLPHLGSAVRWFTPRSPHPTPPHPTPPARAHALSLHLSVRPTRACATSRAGQPVVVVMVVVVVVVVVVDGGWLLVVVVVVGGWFLSLVVVVVGGWLLVLVVVAGGWN